MSVTYTDNTAMVSFDVNRAAALGVRMMLDGVYKESYNFTPKRFGDLRNNVLISVVNTTGTITWSQQYAQYVEDKQFKHYTTPGTGPHFARNAVSKVANSADIYFQRAIGSSTILSGAK